MTGFDIDGIHDSTFRIRACLDGEEVLGEGSTASLALRDAADRLERVEHGREIVPDGGEPSLPRVIADVLEDAEPGGLDRQVVIERVAEVSGATLDEVEEVLGGEIRRGAVITVGGEIKRVPSRRLVGQGGRP